MLTLDAKNVPRCLSLLLQVLSDPRQKRFFKSKDMRDLFTLGDEYANATETSEIFASVNGEVTATLAAGQAPLPELNHAEGLLCTHPGFKAQLNYGQLLPQYMEKKRKEKTTPFGINLMRSQVLYRAAQVLSTFACMCFGCITELTMRI